MGMYDLGDEFSVEIFRVPWLIWIQLLVLFLLFFLLYSFTLFTSDLSDVPTSSSSKNSSDFDIKPVLKVSNTSSLTLNRFQHRQIGDNRSIKGEIATNTGRRIVAESNVEGQSSPISFHPCNYFRLARIAFLKCFGLDSSSENSSRSERKKER